MGLSAKKVLTIGACTIGGIVAAPVVASVAASTLLVSGSAATLGVAEALLFASSTTVGAVGGAAGAAVGGIVNKNEDSKEKKIDSARRSAYNAVSKIYEEKFQKQAEAFLKVEKSCKENKKEYQALIAEMQKYIIKLENDLKTVKENKEEIEKELKKLKGKVADLKKLEE